MGTFSPRMRTTAEELITEFGSACVLTKVEKGQYVASLGRAPEVTTDYDTFSAPAKIMSHQFGLEGPNTNLSGFDTEDVTIPWFGQVIDKTWLYNNSNIVSVKATEAQGDVIIYTLSIATD